MPDDARGCHGPTGLLPRGLGATAALSLLLGCQAGSSVEQPAEEPSPPERSSPETAAPLAGPTPDPDEVPSIEQQREAALPPEPPPVDDNPQRFLDATPATLVAELGEPRLRRRETPAEVWQYRTQGCVLDFFLYQEAQTYKVVHLEARDMSARAVETRSCLRSLLETRRQNPSS